MHGARTFSSLQNDVITFYSIDGLSALTEHDACSICSTTDLVNVSEEILNAIRTLVALTAAKAAATIDQVNP